MATFRSAKEFMAAVLARYRELTSYSDSGYVVTRLGKGEHACKFQTALNPNGDFRFAFERPHPYRPLKHKISRYVVGRVSGKSYLASSRYNGATTVEHWSDLSMPIAGATGISSGAAHTIGGLLFPEVGGWAFTDLKRPRLRSPKVIDGVTCYRVTGLQGTNRVSVYVGMQDLLVRKFSHRNGKSGEVRLGVDTGVKHLSEIFCAPREET